MRPSQSLEAIRLKEELEQSRKRLLNGEFNGALLSALKDHVLDGSDNVFIIQWVPEQGEDLFTVLVNGNQIVEVELSRIPSIQNPVSVKVQSLRDFLNRNPKPSKVIRRKLDIAIQLSR